MSTFYNKIGNKTVAELPVIPTDFEGVYNPATSATTFTWINNNEISGCTNVVQYYKTGNTIWTDLTSLDASAVTYVHTGETINPEGIYSLRVAAYDTGTTRYYPSGVEQAYMFSVGAAYPTNGLLARWSFDDDDLTDSSGNGYDLTYNDGSPTPSYTSGKVEDCIVRGDYEALYATESTLVSQVDTNGHFTIAGWYMITTNSYMGRVGLDQGHWGGAEDNDWIGWTFEANDYLRICQRNNGAAYESVTTILGGDFQLNTWYHVAQTYDGSNQITYLNGQVLNNESSVEVLNGGKSYFILLDGNGEGGRVDNFYFYDNALDSDGIAELYNNGDGV